MKLNSKTALFFVFFPLLSGCQETRLRERTDRLSGSVTDLYYKQALNNLAMMHADPGRLPYFGLPSQGTATIQNALQASYTPNWDLITASGRYFGRVLNDKNAASFQGSTQTTETWQTTPTTTPEKLALLKYAFQKTLGHTDSISEAKLRQFEEIYGGTFAFLNALRPGWYCVGCKKDVPHHTPYVGRYGDVYVWVVAEKSESLSRFVLAILDIASATSKPGEKFIPSVARPGLVKNVDKEKSDSKIEIDNTIQALNAKGKKTQADKISSLLESLKNINPEKDPILNIKATDLMLGNLNLPDIASEDTAGIRQQLEELRLRNYLNSPLIGAATLVFITKPRRPNDGTQEEDGQTTRHDLGSLG